LARQKSTHRTRHTNRLAVRRKGKNWTRINTDKA
jgi:hypothetical protein